MKSSSMMRSSKGLYRVKNNRTIHTCRKTKRDEGQEDI